MEFRMTAKNISDYIDEVERLPATSDDPAVDTIEKRITAATAPNAGSVYRLNASVMGPDVLEDITKLAILIKTYLDKVNNTAGEWVALSDIMSIINGKVFLDGKQVSDIDQVESILAMDGITDAIGKMASPNWVQGGIVSQGGVPVHTTATNAVRCDVFNNSPFYLVRCPADMQIGAFYFAAVEKSSYSDPQLKYAYEFSQQPILNFTFINEAVMTKREIPDPSNPGHTMLTTVFPSLIRLVARWADGRDITPADAETYIKIYDLRKATAKLLEQSDDRATGNVICYKNKTYVDSGCTWEMGDIRSEHWNPADHGGAPYPVIDAVINACRIRSAEDVLFPPDARSLLIYNPNGLQVSAFTFFANEWYETEVSYNTDKYITIDYNGKRRYRFEAAATEMIETETTPRIIPGRIPITPEGSGLRIYWETTDSGHSIDSFAAGAVRSAAKAYFEPWETLTIERGDGDTRGVPFIQVGNLAEGANYPKLPDGYKCQSMIYSSVFYLGGDVPWNRSFATFYSALKNPFSVLYTKIGGVVGKGRASYYGSICSSLAQYIAGVDIWLPTDHFNIAFADKKLDSETLTFAHLRPGMMLSQNGHEILIVDVYYSNGGKYVDIVEASRPVVRYHTYTWEELLTVMEGDEKDGPYGVYDISDLFTLRETKIDPYATDVIGEYGNNTWYLSGGDVNMYVAPNADGERPEHIYYRLVGSTEWSVAETAGDITNLKNQLMTGEWELTTDMNNAVYARIKVVNLGQPTLAVNPSNPNELIVTASGTAETPAWWKIFVVSDKKDQYDVHDDDGYALEYVSVANNPIANTYGHFVNGSAVLPIPTLSSGENPAFRVRVYFDTGYGISYKDTNKWQLE